MKIWIAILFLIFLPMPGLGMEESQMHDQEHHSPEGHHKSDTGFKEDKGIRKYADNALSGNREKFSMQPIHDSEILAVFRLDRLEYQTGEGKDTLLWDVQAWVGDDYNKLWLKSEGLRLADKDRFEEAEFELLYSRNIASFWDLQAGIRHDFEPHPTRTFAAFGAEGLARYWFEVEATAYVSEDGDISANFEAEYDLFLSQRLIIQPRFDINAAVQKVEEYNIGQGLNDLELGIRLRYEIRREFAPYMGISWSRKIGETADLTKADGDDIDVFSFLIGIKLWF